MSDIIYTADELLPFDAEQPASTRPRPAVLGAPFAYLGQALTLPEFERYVAGYHFGTIPPDSIVVHHTAIPATQLAPYGDANRFWDAGESGMREDQKVAKRLRQLASIRDVYKGRGWPAGPHLFIDDLRIYLFTPMNTVGIHAAQGNSSVVNGTLRYAVGLEVVGYYEHVTWPRAVEDLVGGACAVLCTRLNIPLVHTVSGRGISAHRDYNKPQCPGAKITTDYYLGVIGQHMQAADPWQAWGDAYPLAPERRTWAIPQCWRQNRATLGACRSDEIYSPDGSRSIQWFQGGACVYEKASNRVQLIDLVDVP